MPVIAATANRERRTARMISPRGWTWANAALRPLDVIVAAAMRRFDDWPLVLSSIDWTDDVSDATLAAMQVRRARREDSGGIAAVHVQSWQAGYEGLFTASY